MFSGVAEGGRVPRGEGRLPRFLSKPPCPPQTSDISVPLLCVPRKGAKNSLILPSHGLPTCKAEMSRCQFVKSCGIKD